MTGLSLYDTTIPPLKIYLNNLHHILTVVEDHYAAQSTCLDPTTARLSDDMYSLAQQVQCACKAAQNIPLLVLGEEVTGNVFYENDEQTFDDLKTRILDTIKFIDGSGHSELKGAKAFGREAFEGTENFEVTWQTYKFTGLVYVTHFALPNFFFHVVTAYDILRARGVKLGKADFAMGRSNVGHQLQAKHNNS